MGEAPVRVVLDTNALLSAIGWSGPPARILTALMEGTHNLIISPQLLDELTRALRYPKLRRVSALPSIPLVLAWLHRPEHIVLTVEKVQAIQTDPTDDLVLEAAVAGRADAIISGDHHLLRLGSFRGIPIMTAREFAAKYL